MTIRSIASVLVDFHQAAARPIRSFDTSPMMPPEPAVDVDALVSDAEARGHARGRAEAQEECAAEAARQAEDAAQLAEMRIAEARSHWVEEEGMRVAAQLEAALDQLQELIADRAAVVLQALMAPALRQRMLAELLQAVHVLTRDDETMLLRVEGPGDLIESIRTALGGKVRSVDLVAGEGPDVRVIARDSVIETHLGAWLAAAQEGSDA